MEIHKIDRKWGSRGLVPLGCLPLRGREGVTLAIPTEYVLERFSPEQKSAQPLTDLTLFPQSMSAIFAILRLHPPTNDA
jgi:hypothetical protein